MAHTSASMTKKSEELGLYIDNIAGDCQHNAATTPLPVISLSPFPHWNMNETSQYYASGNLNIGSSQLKSSQNFQMDYNNLYRAGEHNSRPYRPDYGFPCTQQGYTGLPYQHTRHGNLTISDDGTNASLNPNSFEKPGSGGKCVNPTDISANRPQMANPSGTSMSGDIRQSLPNTNLGMTQFNPNQAGAEPLLTPGNNYERFITVGSGSNKESESITTTPKVNVAGNSERAFHPPINTYHNQLGSRSFSSPGLDMNRAFTGFQKGGGTSSNFANAGHHEYPFNSKTGMHLGPSYGFQWPTVGDQNHYLRQANRDCAKDIGMEFADVEHRNQIGRSMVVPSIPIVDSQTMPCESSQRRVDGQLVPFSIGMVTDQSPSEILPKNNGKFSSHSIPRPPLVVGTRSTRVQDPSKHNGQSQVVGSIQQSSSLPRQHSASDQAIQTVKENMTAQVSRPPIISSLKRPASQPLSYTVQDQRRKTLPTQPFIHQSVPTWTRLAPSVPNTHQSIPPLIHAAQSPTLQATQSSVSPLLPYTLSLPNTTQAIAPSIPPAPSLPPIDKRTSSFRPSPHPPLLPNQQLIAQSLARQSTPLMPPLPSQQLIAQSLNQQLIAQSLACQGRPMIPPALLNQQLIAQSLAWQGTPLIPPPLPNQQLVAQFLARQHTTLVPPPLPNQQLAAQSLARQRTLLIPPPASTTPLPNQQLAAQSLARQRTLLIPPPASTTGSYIKYKDQTPEPNGYKCLLCKRDLSFKPEGPISQPPVPPTVAVLSCGHTFHEYCLERITPDDQTKDPPCIPCALGA